MQLRVLGVLEVQDDDLRRGPGDLGGRKPKQILELLAAAGGRPVHKDSLVSQLWGDSPPRHPVAALENHVWVLRQHLPGRAPVAPVVVAAPASYRLAVDRVSLDLRRFEALREAAGGCEPDDAAHHLREALSLVRGELFEDEPYAEWAHDLRVLFRTKVTDARLDLGELALGAGDLTTALAQAERVVNEDPLNEPGVRLLMRAHLRRADRPRALAAFTALRTRLRAELDVEPSQETLTLHAAVHEASGLIGVSPGQRGPRSGGTRMDPGSLAATGRGPLVGRQTEIARLVADLREGLVGGGLVLVEGFAHVGKTRVVEEACSRLAGTRTCRVTLAAGSSGLAQISLATTLGSSRDIGEALLRSSTATMECVARSIMRAAPILLVVDDIHHGEGDTTSLLTYLTVRLRGVPAVIVAVGRREEIPVEHPLRTLPWRSHVRIDPLGREALGGDAARLLRTGGYGAYLAAWLRGECAGPPSGDLLEAVLARCRTAGPAAYRVLLAASAFGGSFAPSRLAAATGIGLQQVAEELDHLTARDLLHELGSHQFAFTSTLVADALRSQLSRTRRTLLTSVTPATAGGSVG